MTNTNQKTYKLMENIAHSKNLFVMVNLFIQNAFCRVVRYTLLCGYCTVYVVQGGPKLREHNK